MQFVFLPLATTELPVWNRYRSKLCNCRPGMHEKYTNACIVLQTNEIMR